MHRWSEAATIRKTQIESGIDITFHKVFLPFYKNELHQIRPNNTIDIGCGTGHLIKYLADELKFVIGIDPSKGMADIATNVVGDYATIYWSTVEKFETEIKFDLALSHLCLHTVNDLSSFLLAVHHLLNIDGSFIFSIPHPCFWNNYKSCISKDSYNYMEEKEVEMTLTITKDKINEMVVPYIHRPLSSYFRLLVNSDFLVEEFHEVFPPQDVQDLYDKPWQEPRYIIIKCRKKGDPLG